MPVREMTDAEAEEIFGDGLIIFGSGLRPPREASLKRKKLATPAKPDAKPASARKPSTTKKAARKGA